MKPQELKIHHLLERAFSDTHAVLYTCCILAIGIALRFYHYLRHTSLWCDEAVMVINLVNKSFRELLGPLDYNVAGPPLFLWLSKIDSLLFGDNVYAWRLLPLVASCGALLLLVPLARRLLAPAMVPWALLLVACNDKTLWHSSEIRPYTIDLFCSTFLLYLYYSTRRFGLVGRLAYFIALAPLLLPLSYPSMFIYAGLFVALWPEVWQEKSAAGFWGYGILALVLIGGAMLLFIGPVRAQDTPGLRFFWVRYFPDWSQPWLVPAWAIRKIFEMLRYCMEPTGGLLLPFVLIAGVTWWRNGQKPTVALLVLPMLLGLIASLLGFYPFGHTRLQLHLAPAAVLLALKGLETALTWFAPGRRWRLAIQLLLVLLLLAPAALTAKTLLIPWPARSADAKGAADYVKSRMQQTDILMTSDNWEFDYYFRDVKSYKRGIQRVADAGRLWLVVSDAPPLCDNPREELNQFIRRDWRLLEQRDFSHIAVFLLAGPQSRQDKGTDNLDN